jgi:hypothetical protein
MRRLEMMAFVPAGGDTGDWRRFLVPWALATALVTLVTVLVFFIAMTPPVPGSGIGLEYADLVSAAANPGGFRIHALLDAVGWLGLAGTLLGLAGLLGRAAPLRARLVTICAAGVLVGVFAGFLRLDGVSDLAIRYGMAGPEQRAAVQQSYLDLRRVMGAGVLSAQFFAAGGYLLAATAAWRWAGIPRGVAIALALPGITALVQFAGTAAGALPYLFPVLFLHILVVIAAHVSLSLTLWRRPVDDARESAERRAVVPAS